MVKSSRRFGRRSVVQGKNETRAARNLGFLPEYIGYGKWILMMGFRRSSAGTRMCFMGSLGYLILTWLFLQTDVDKKAYFNISRSVPPR